MQELLQLLWNIKLNFMGYDVKKHSFKGIATNKTECCECIGFKAISLNRNKENKTNTTHIEWLFFSIDE